MVALARIGCKATMGMGDFWRNLRWEVRNRGNLEAVPTNHKGSFPARSGPASDHCLANWLGRPQLPYARFPPSVNFARNRPSPSCRWILSQASTLRCLIICGEPCTGRNKCFRPQCDKKCGSNPHRLQRHRPPLFH
jgi:hypothetical protein